MTFKILSKEESKEKIKKLVDQFNFDFGDSAHPHMKEAQLEEKYIKPLFSSLNWNIHNEGIAKGKEEFRVQTSHKINKTTKEPDYEFWVPDTDSNNMKRILFMEAKDPKYDLSKETKYMRQAYQYAHSTLNLSDHSFNRTRLSILTDFEEFKLFDCFDPYPLTKDDSEIYKKYIVKPFDLNYKNYIENFDDLWDAFERNNVYNGSLDEFQVNDDDLKKNRIAPDLRFLDDLKSWRLEFARSMYKSNKDVSDEFLTSATQLLINRIIFLKMLTDRAIEEDYLSQILDKIKKEKEEISIYDSCNEIFNNLDKRYNGDIFKRRDEFDYVIIENKVFLKIIESLRPEKSIYTLSAMPIEIIGNAYEQFLGEVIVHKGKGLSSEQKPEVQKAGGVYYTPRYIVDHIIENTVGERLKKCKNPKEVESIKIIDPACGSGSFLIGAYDYLLEWHINYYKKEIDLLIKKGTSEFDIKKKYRNELKYYSIDSEDVTDKFIIHLTSKLKKNILLNNIFGVDIDNNAVEITRFSLSMKSLEHANREELYEDVNLFNEKLLPELKDNIKCGNSLIEDDYFNEHQKDLFDNSKSKKINAFTWDEKFKGVTNNGKFDIVIGNPPWVSLSGKFGNDILSAEELAYLIKKYNGNTYMPNLYEYFVWKGLHLCKENGLFAFIVPDRLGFNQQFINLRKHILDNFTIKSLIYKAHFPGVIADTLIYVFLNVKDNNAKIDVKEYGYEFQIINQKDYYKNNDFSFTYQKSDVVGQLLSKIDTLEHKKLVECFDTTGGFGGKSKLITDERINDKQIVALKGESIGKYLIKKKFYFEFKKQNITGRTTDKNKLGAKPKILLRKTGYPLYGAYDDEGIFPEQSLYFLFNNKTEQSYYFYLGIINSKLFNFYYWNKLVTNKNTTPQLKKIHLDIFPVPCIDSDESKLLAESISSCVESILSLLKNKIVDTAQLEKLESFLNKKVYTLYKLNNEDIDTLINYI